jgi:hypothetical protein
MNDGTRRTNSINRSKSCLFNINTHRTDDGRIVKEAHTVERNAMCARNQLSLSINTIRWQKHTYWLPPCPLHGQYRHISFLFLHLSVFLDDEHQRPSKKHGKCTMHNMTVNVSFRRFSKPFEEIFQFDLFTAIIDIGRWTSFDQHNDRHCSANVKNNNDYSIKKTDGRYFVYNMKRHEDESSEHSSSLRSS